MGKTKYSNKKGGNFKYAVTAVDGSKLYTSMSRAKKVTTSRYMAKKLKCSLRVLPDFTFALVDKSGEYICGRANKGKSLNSIRRWMGERIAEKNGGQNNAS